jgi:hypothetical protein
LLDYFDLNCELSTRTRVLSAGDTKDWLADVLRKQKKSRRHYQLGVPKKQRKKTYRPKQRKKEQERECRQLQRVNVESKSRKDTPFQKEKNCTTTHNGSCFSPWNLRDSQTSSCFSCWDEKGTVESVENCITTLWGTKKKSIVSSVVTVAERNDWQDSIVFVEEKGKTNKQRPILKEQSNQLLYSSIHSNKRDFKNWIRKLKRYVTHGTFST